MTRLARIPAVLLVLAGGLVHLQLWQDGYRGIPRIGPLFLANVALSVALAVALVVTVDRRVAAAAVLLAVGSLAGLVLSRTVGLLGFMDSAWTTQSLRAVAAEVGVLVAVAVAVVAQRRLPAPPTLVSALVRADGGRRLRFR